MIEKDVDGGAYQIALGYGYRGEVNLRLNGWIVRARKSDSGLIAMKVSTLLKNLHLTTHAGCHSWRKMGLA